MNTMKFEDLEAAYELIAEAIDQAGEQRESLFLTRLALLLANDLGDLARFSAAITEALDMEPQHVGSG